MDQLRGINASRPMYTDTKRRFNLTIAIIFMLVVGVWVGSLWLITHYVESSNPALLTHEAARGVFGDQFGAVNALFSGLAFSGVIVTLLLQQREIKRQSYSLQRQQFESGLFHLLSMYSSIIEQLDISGQKGRKSFEMFLRLMQIHTPQVDAFEALKPLNRTEIAGIEATGIISDELKVKHQKRTIESIEEVLKRTDGRSLIAQYREENFTEHLNIIRTAYIEAHVQSKDALSHYFRTLYHILRYVDDSALIDDAEKIRYAKLVGAQLSGLELATIFYNSLIPKTEIAGAIVEFGYPSMLTLLKKYDLMRHLNASVLFHPIHLRVFNDLATRVS